MQTENKTLSTSMSKLGLEILRRSSPQENLVISPTSILVAMAMLHEGATGATRDEIASLFGRASESSFARQLGELLSKLTQQRILDDRALELIDEGEPEFRISPANSIWLQEGYEFRRAFADLVRSYLSGTVRTIDMIGNPASAAKEVNEWIDQATNGCIHALVSENNFSRLSRFLVCNALYFKATWKVPFGPPIPGEFHLLEGSTVNAQMIIGGGRGKRYAIEKHHWAVELSYANDDVAMIVIVPSERGPAPLRTLEDQLTTVLKKLSFKSFGSFDTFTIPAFSVSSILDISNHLRDVGIEMLFSEEAELSGISDARPLWVDSVLHGATIEVDRYGTEASAVTIALLFGAVPPPEPLDLVVDRPFIFMVIDKPTDTVLFLGRVADPTTGEGSLKAPDL
jgi:serpin B